jgi:metal-dependent amidase/aminoacylase/carboxypeptidase family protein
MHKYINTIIKKYELIHKLKYEFHIHINKTYTNNTQRFLEFLTLKFNPLSRWSNARKLFDHPEVNARIKRTSYSVW